MRRLMKILVWIWQNPPLDCIFTFTHILSTIHTSWDFLTAILCADISHVYICVDCWPQGCQVRDFEMDASIFEIPVWEGFSEITGHSNILFWCCVDRASYYDLCKWPTCPTILFHMFVYSNSLYVSSNQVLIIRRVNCINTTSGLCHCM